MVVLAVNEQGLAGSDGEGLAVVIHDALAAEGVFDQVGGQVAAGGKIFRPGNKIPQLLHIN